MSGESLAGRLLNTFIAELEDQTQALSDGFLTLERTPADSEALRAVFRSAHTIKGAARVAGVPAIETLCHDLESRIAELRDRGEIPEASDFKMFFHAVDELQAAAAKLRGDKPAESVPQDRETAPDLAVAGAAAPAAATAKTAAELARVPAHKLEHLVTGSTELMLAAARLDADRSEFNALREALTLRTENTAEVFRRIDRVLTRLDRDIRTVARGTAVVNAAVYSLRLRRFGDVIEALPRAVRDVAEAEDKRVDLERAGEDVEADRIVMDSLREPLLHLVRNAVSHGIETPARRQAAGKSEEGMVRVSASIQAGRLVVTVSDDGGGVDTVALRRSLERRGQPAPAADDQVARALFYPGVSTAPETTAVSGRGVGLDLARSVVERLGGNIRVEWQAGLGTSFIIELPPSPTLMRVVLLRIASHEYAIPMTHIERLVRVQPSSVGSVDGKAVLTGDGAPVPITSLAAALGPPLHAQPITEAVPGIVLTMAGERAVVTADELLGEDEIVLRPLSRDARASPHVMGGALLASGRVALVLNGAALLRAALEPASAAQLSAPAAARPALRVLVADDSITTRTLEQSVLEAAGYQVTTAVDGQDAWDKLQRGGFDVVVSDVEMPRLNGFELCERIRASNKLRDLPVLLVTGRESAEDRARGLDAGADAYIVKSTFDQNVLLNTLRNVAGG